MPVPRPHRRRADAGPLSVRVIRPTIRDPRFVMLLAAQTVNSVGGWACGIALWGFAAYRYHAGPLPVALLTLCWAAPPAVLGPLLGMSVDRLGPQRALTLGYLAAAAAAAGLASAGSPAALALAAVGYGVTRALTGPAAAALPPRIVAGEDLLAANSLLGAAGPAGQILGPLAASATLAAAGFRAVFLMDAASYLIAAWAVATLPGRPRPGPPERPERTGPRAGQLAGLRVSLLAGLRHGLAEARQQRVVRVLLGLGAAVTFTSGAFLVIEPLYAGRVLGRPPAQFALFEAVAGTGAVLASLAMSRFPGRLMSRWPGRLTGVRAAAVAACGYGVSAAAFSGTPWIPVAYAGAFAWGVSGAVFAVILTTALQQQVPVQAHGRVMGLAAALYSAADTAGLPAAAIVLVLLSVRAGALALAGVAVVAGLAAATRGPRLRIGGCPRAGPGHNC